MSILRYRATLLLCVLAWFIVGLHAPALHQITHHGQLPRWPVLAAVGLVTMLGMVSLWRLLRAPTTVRAPSSASAA